MPIDDNIQTVLWPAEYGDYKVVQLEVAGRKFLRFDDGKGLHGTVLRDFLRSQRLSYETFRGEASGELIPKPQGEGYRVVGMGHVDIDSERKRAWFIGSSADYKIGLDERHVLEVTKGSGWEVTFGF